jgi:hypothetical protein
LKKSAILFLNALAFYIGVANITVFAQVYLELDYGYGYFEVSLEEYQRAKRLKRFAYNFVHQNPIKSKELCGFKELVKKTNYQEIFISAGFGYEYFHHCCIDCNFIKFHQYDYIDFNSQQLALDGKMKIMPSKVEIYNQLFNVDSLYLGDRYGENNNSANRTIPLGVSQIYLNQDTFTCILMLRNSGSFTTNNYRWIIASKNNNQITVIPAADWHRTSSTAVFGDFNNNGKLDFLSLNSNEDVPGAKLEVYELENNNFKKIDKYYLMLFPVHSAHYETYYSIDLAKSKWFFDLSKP